MFEESPHSTLFHTLFKTLNSTNCLNTQNFFTSFLIQLPNDIKMELSVHSPNIAL